MMKMTMETLMKKMTKVKKMKITMKKKMNMEILTVKKKKS
jgi:hypothetical protein